MLSKKHAVNKSKIMISEGEPGVGRRQGRGWRRGRGRYPGPGPLDVRHGGAHEPRDLLPPPSLHVAQRDRSEDVPHRPAAATTER